MQWCEGQNEKMMLMKGWEDPKRDIVLPEESFRFRQDPFFKDEKILQIQYKQLGDLDSNVQYVDLSER